MTKAEMQARLELLESRLATAGKSTDTHVTVTVGKFKGKEVIQFQGGGLLYPMSMGKRKARIIMDNASAVQKWLKGEKLG